MYIGRKDINTGQCQGCQGARPNRVRVHAWQWDSGVNDPSGHP